MIYNRRLKIWESKEEAKIRRRREAIERSRKCKAEKLAQVS